MTADLQPPVHGWETDEPNDWTEDDRVTAAQAADLLEAERVAANICTRHRPPALDACTRGYDHTGPCDWFAEAIKRNYTIADLAAQLGTDPVHIATTIATTVPRD